MAINLINIELQHPHSQTLTLIHRTNHSLTRVPKILPTYRTRESSYWTSIESDVESYLKKAIPIRPPESVFEPMHHLTFSAPKTTASSLCVAACELVGGHRSHAMTAAAALHLMHAAAYAHESLLATTDGRRLEPDGLPPRFGPNIQLLTGDGIVPFGLELLARPAGSERADHDRVLRVIVEITRACGSQGLDGSESEVIEASAYACKKREEGMHACGAACGAILGGGNEVEIEKLRRFGQFVGMVRGMMGKKSDPSLGKKIEELKEMAFEELDGFEGLGLGLRLISSIFEPAAPLMV